MKGKWVRLTRFVEHGFIIAGLGGILIGGSFESVHASRRTISSLPFTASVNNDTIDLAGTKVISSSSGIRVTASNVVLNLGSDTIAFSSGSGVSIEGAHFVKVLGGTVIKSAVSGSSARGMTVNNAHDLFVSGTKLIVNGHNAQCVNVVGGSSSTYNLNFDGGEWRNNSESFTSRETYSGAVFYSGSFPATAGLYDVRIANVNITNGPCQGIIVKGEFVIENCRITTDARNVYWDSVYLWNNIQAPVGSSADNSYLILCRNGEPGTIIRNNTLVSGTQYGGSRGIMLENCAGTPTNPIEVYNNHCTIHAGPSGENLRGVARVIRMRAIDGGATRYVRIHDNTFIGIADNNPTTKAIGEDVAVMNLGFPSSSDTCYVERNRFIAKSTTSGTKTKACESTYNGSSFAHVVRNNYFSSSSTIIYLGDEYNGMGTSRFRFRGDTLTFDPDYTFSKKTWYIGYGGNNSLDNIAIDCKFVNGASDTNIVWYATSGSNEMTLARTVDVLVRGNNALPVSGATVTVKNNYGQTVLAGTTAANGRVSGQATYWYAADDTADSTNFSNFSLKVKKGNDSATVSFAVNANSAAPTATLQNTPGSGSGGSNTVPTVPVPVSPINGASVTAMPVRLTVANSIDANNDPVRYDFWISTNSSFTQIVDSVKNLSAGSGQTQAIFTSFVPVEGTTYWWRARAGDGIGWSSTSAPATFTYTCTISASIATLTGLVSYMFNGGPQPSRTDWNGDGATTVMDLSFIVSYLFNNGPSPSCDN